MNDKELERLVVYVEHAGIAIHCDKCKKVHARGIVAINVYMFGRPQPYLLGKEELKCSCGHTVKMLELFAGIEEAQDRIAVLMSEFSQKVEEGVDLILHEIQNPSGN
ncbi:MAG TPA: hypothetical protein VJH94_03715 [Candidatus Paceibacterota bacterium]